MKKKIVNKKFLKIICIVIVCVSLMVFLGTINAAINETYSIDTEVKEDNLDEKAKSSVLLDALGNLIYVLACFGEWLLGVIFKSIAGSVAGNSGVATFPWADAILFNAVPVLDINFMNPAEGSIVIIIQGIIARLYGTVFGLAITFFSIIMLIMGLKVAVSTIAAEKAKYKQAVWDWFLGLVMLFCMHFFISFTFYLNEQLVIKASDIVNDALADAEKAKRVQLEMESEAKLAAAQEHIDAFIYQMNSSTIEFQWVWDRDFDTDALYYMGLDTVPMQYLVLPSMWELYEDESKKAVETEGNKVVVQSNGKVKWKGIINNRFWGLPFDHAGLPELNSSHADYGKFWHSCETSAEYKKYLKEPENAKLAISLLSNKDYMDYRMPHIADDVRGDDPVNGLTKANNGNYIRLLAFDVCMIKNNYFWMYEGISNMEYWENDVYKLAEIMTDFTIEYNKTKDVKVMSEVSIINNLAAYFKENAWGIPTGMAWGGTRVSIQNAIMYAILVVQSFIFLLAYFKRVFFVLVLAMMAPLVVVYDFFNKSMS